MARRHVQTEYGIKLHDGIDSNTIYTQIIHSQEQREEYMPYIKAKLGKAGLTRPQQRSYLSNYKRILRWIPCYARYNNISISHNMLPTFRRFGEHSPCFLCGGGEDCVNHLYGSCAAVNLATRQIRASLNLPNAPLSLALSVGADSERAKDDLSVQVMLANSVWRARTNAKKGDKRAPEAWAGWIVADCVQRICSLSPSFFSTNFPKNNIPNRHKIIYKPDLGSSKRRATAQATAAIAVDAHINSLLPNTLLAFTDGSAKPNPGPAGAGAVVLNKTSAGFSHCANYTAAIGCASNNTGELYAVGVVLEHCKLTKYKGNLHIYTDSKISYGALKNGWRAGKANSDILFAVRAIAHDIRHSCKVHYHWIPGHSDVKFNDMADALANAGSDYSKSHRCEKINFNDSLITNGFMALVTEIDTDLF
jgi:ribonuclease HI